MTRYVALVPAAGTGSRFGKDRPKQYIDMLGKPMLAHSVEVLGRHPRVSAVAVVISADDTWFQRFDWEVSGAKLQFHRVGGETRAQSVRNGLLALDGDIGADDWVLVHDAARPCLSIELLDRLIDGVGDDAIGGLLAARIADTLKSADDSNRVSGTRPLVIAAAPSSGGRAFRLELLNEAEGFLAPERSGFCQCPALYHQ